MAEANAVPPQGETAGIPELMEARATMYELLARVFHKEVDAEFLDQLTAMRYPQNSENPAVNEAFRRVYSFVRHARDGVLDELASEYARVFLGSGVLNGNAAYPYESVYTNEKRLIMQEAEETLNRNSEL